MSVDETQWAVRNPLWAVALAIGALSVGVGLWQAGGQPRLMVGLGAGGLALGALGAGHLHVRLEKDALRIRFFPLFARRILLTEILFAEVVGYRPVKDFGGRGIRFGRGGVAYTISGTRAVFLRLASHRDLYVGTRQAEAWAASLEAAGVPDGRDDGAIAEPA